MDVEEIFSILEDEYSRKILKATSIEPMSAKELGEKYNMSASTVSRRLNKLSQQGLIKENTKLDPDGHHYSVYKTNLEKISIELREGSFKIKVEIEEDAVDRFTTMWQEMREI